MGKKDPPEQPGQSTDPSTEQSTDPDQVEKPPFGNLWRILGHGDKLDRVTMIVSMAFAAGSGIALPLMNILIGRLVSDFNGYFIQGSGVTKEEFMDSVEQNVLLIVYIFIGKFLLGYMSMFCLRMTGISISSKLRLAYLRALFKQPIRVFDELPIGRPTSTITTSANSIQAGISDKIAVLVQNIALVISAYVVAFTHSWKLTLISTCVLFAVGILYGTVVPIFINLQKKVDNADENASSVAGEALASIRTIVACGAEGRLALRYRAWVDEASKRYRRISPLMGVQLFPSGFAMYSNFALTFWYGIKMYASGELPDVGPVVIVIFSIMIVSGSMSFIVSPMMALSKAISASTNFFQILDAPTIDLSGLKDPDVSAEEDIRFTNVNFSYPSRPGVKVLNDLSLSFPAGKVTALVGPSGCGKSTIVALLERWYQISNQLEGGQTEQSIFAPRDTKDGDDDSKGTEEDNNKEKSNNDDDDDKTPVKSGTVTVGSHNIDDLDLKWWRSQIGLVQQEPFSFNASIYTNVSYGLVGSTWEDEPEEKKRSLVKDACQEAFASEFIERLPDGYDTVIGENGIKLSGGQRQRLAIARSIISKPPILILDEATSSIDVRGERIVQEALDRVSKNRTTITIAHRLSTIKKADKIIVLKNGSMVEEGNHEELLDKQGLYHSLVESQQLEMAEEDENDISAEDSDGVDTSPVTLTKTESKSARSQTQVDTDESSSQPEYKQRSLVRSVGLFLWEQRTYWLYYLAVLVSAAGCGASFSVQAYLFAQFIKTFQYTGSKLMEQRDFWALMFFILALGSGACYFVLGWVSSSISKNISAVYKQQYFESIIRKPIGFYDQEENSAGSLTSRLSTDPTQLQELLGINMAFPLISLYNVIGCISIAFAFGWKLTVVAMFTAFPLIISAMFVRIRYEVTFEKMNAAVFAESSQFASEAIGAFRTVTSLTLENSITDRYSTLLNSHVKSAFHKAKYAGIVFALSDSLDLPCMALCFWYGGKLLSTHEYDVVQFFVIYIAVVLGGQAAGQFGAITPNMAQASAAANRIISLRLSGDDDSQGREHLEDTEGGASIEFKSVHFSYPTRDVPVFKDLSLSIEKGQFAAMVGPSGCGKTSSISLLERFYDYQRGSILVNGTELRSLELEQYRKNLSLVLQEPSLYQGSIRDNVLLGVDKDSVTEDQIIQACRDAEVHDFIQSLPEGYSTDVGQRGLALSGGQKQRICIARALMRNPRILLLDEATSSLDSESEKLVQRAFERTAKGRTVLVVAHRLATVQNADVIFVFGEGGVIEQGNHHSLLRKRGAYFQMCESQALDR